MNKRILLKQIGLKSTLQLRDFYQVHVDEDRKDLHDDIGQYVELEDGDMITIIIHKSK